MKPSCRAEATETLNATIEFLAQKVAAGEIIDFEHPEVEDAWVWAHGIKVDFFLVDG